MTIPLDEFRAAYAQDDNEWWRTDCGDHMNLFDEACDRIDALAAKTNQMRAWAEDFRAQRDAAHAILDAVRALHQPFALGSGLGDNADGFCSAYCDGDPTPWPCPTTRIIDQHTEKEASHD